MSHTPNYDAAVKQILDATQPGERVCALSGEKWTMTEKEIEWYKKFNVPPSKYAPWVRAAVCLAWGTGCQWWWNTHPETGKPLFSHVHPATGYSVLPDNEWHAKDFSREVGDFDWNDSVSNQLRRLMLATPFPAWRNSKPTENSIAFTSLGDINSYFVMACQTKNSFFGVSSRAVEYSAEFNLVDNVQESFNIVHSDNIFRSFFVRESRSCMDSAFMFDCRNCSDCFMATNQRNKKFLWYNEQLSEAEYRAKRSQVDLSTRSVFEKYLSDFHALIEKEAIWPENFNETSENCTGEYLDDCRDCHNCYFVKKSNRCENCSYSWLIPNEDSYCAQGMVGTSDCYYSVTTANGQNVKFSNVTFDCRGIEFCFHCFNCENCFGCVGLKHKKFHVFNRPVTEEEYYSLVDRLKCKMLEEGFYGDFVPTAWSYVNVPESAARFYQQLDVAQIEKLNYNHFDITANGALGQISREPIDVREVPEQATAEVVENWANKPLVDHETERQFAFLKPELELYARLGFPVPNKHFIRRMKQFLCGANSFNFSSGACAGCGKPITVAKNEEFPNRIFYCRKCYNDFIEKRN